MTPDESPESGVEEENYFVSMTDMMVGLVFIFIILLMYYVLQFRDVTDQLTGAERTRTLILKDLEKSLVNKGVPVELDENNGILRLPDAILFDSARSELKPTGEVAVGHLAEALGKILPCYTDAIKMDVVKVEPRPKDCRPDNHHRIEALYVEGHTDSDTYKGGRGINDNWDLSALRATNTYRKMTAWRPDLAGRCSISRGGKCEPVLSVSGYGAQRRIDFGLDDKSKQHNRRIDLRIIMVTPDSGQTARAVSKSLAKP